MCWGLRVKRRTSGSRGGVGCSCPRAKGGSPSGAGVCGPGRGKWACPSRWLLTAADLDEEPPAASCLTTGGRRVPPAGSAEGWTGSAYPRRRVRCMTKRPPPRRRWRGPRGRGYSLPGLAACHPGEVSLLPVDLRGGPASYWCLVVTRADAGLSLDVRRATAVRRSSETRKAVQVVDVRRSVTRSSATEVLLLSWSTTAAATSRILRLFEHEAW